MSLIVRDKDVAETQRRLPALEVVVVEDAGRAVQNDWPLVLAEFIGTFAL